MNWHKMLNWLLTVTSKEYRKEIHTFWRWMCLPFIFFFFISDLFDFWHALRWNCGSKFSTFHLLNSICSVVFFLISVHPFHLSFLILCNVFFRCFTRMRFTFESTLCRIYSVVRALTFTFYDKLILILSQDQTNLNQSYVTY